MTQQQDILDYLKKAAREDLQLAPEQIDGIRPEVLLAEGLPLDSLAATILVTKIESDFGIMFEPEDMQKVRTIGDLIGLIQQHASEKKA